MFQMQKLQKNMSLLQGNFFILKRNAIYLWKLKKKKIAGRGTCHKSSTLSQPLVSCSLSHVPTSGSTQRLESFKVQVHPKKEGRGRMVQPTPYLLLQDPIQIFSYWNHPSECKKLAWIRCSPSAQETCHFFLLYHDEFPIVTLINGPMNTIIRIIWFFPPILSLTG